VSLSTTAVATRDHFLFVIPAKAGIQKTWSEAIKQPAVYILASAKNGTLYIGVTSDLVKRVWEHKNNLIEGFTKRYNVHNLVWYELHENMNSAIEREKGLKEGKRVWKFNLIEKSNPNWNDLYDTIT
jgi:putative endonuclease